MMREETYMLLLYGDIHGACWAEWHYTHYHTDREMIYVYIDMRYYYTHTLEERAWCYEERQEICCCRETLPHTHYDIILTYYHDDRDIIQDDIYIHKRHIYEYTLLPHTHIIDIEQRWYFREEIKR